MNAFYHNFKQDDYRIDLAGGNSVEKHKQLQRKLKSEKKGHTNFDENSVDEFDKKAKHSIKNLLANMEWL